MTHLSLFDAFLILGIGQGILLALAIAALKNHNRPANLVLTAIILAATLMLAGRLARWRFIGEWIDRLAILVDITIFLFGPLMLFYVRKLLRPLHGVNYSNWGHLVPALLHFSFFLWTCSLSYEALQLNYRSYAFGVIFFVMECGGLLSITCYVIWSFLILKKSSEVEMYSSTYSVTIKQYLQGFLVAISGLSMFWMISFLDTYFFQWGWSHFNYNMVWVLVPTFLYVVGYFSLKTPEILRIPLVIKKSVDRLSNDEIDTLQRKLNQIMQYQRAYEDPGLTLQDLADKLGTSGNNLSWLLNRVYKKSFYDYLNSIRVDAFQQKIFENEHSHKTLLALAMDVGFNSKSTFNKAFKSFARDTPSNYIRKLKATA